MNEHSLGWRLGGIGLFGSAIVVGIPANYIWHCYTLPPIHDISTDIRRCAEVRYLARLAQGRAQSGEL